MRSRIHDMSHDGMPSDQVRRVYAGVAMPVGGIHVCYVVFSGIWLYPAQQYLSVKKARW